MDRKELKRQYKQTRPPMGVYRLVNRGNGKVLVGSSVNLPAIFNRLRMELNNGMHRKYPALQEDWKEQGAEAFEMEVIEELPPSDDPGWDPSEDLRAMEELWLEQLSPYEDRGYNRR